MLPPALARRIEGHFPQIGLQARIVSASTVGGGCIHNAFKLTTTAGPYFLKWNTTPQPGMFSSEAHGITQIRTADAIRTPDVHLFSDQTVDNCPGFILMEWIETDSRIYDFALLGEKLAALHRTLPRNMAYGLEIDNYIGSSPQENSWSTDWITFFGDRRLAFQLSLAVRNGKLTASRRAKLEQLLQHLDRYLGGIVRQPSLLHGDLWTGNILSGPRSEPCLIDPAVFYGDREAEIAFTELFGGFPSRFYQAYNSCWPLESGYIERRDIYNLYHLLNHLNIFGESYGQQIDTILRTYLGK